jgi:hypothetical protein
VEGWENVSEAHFVQAQRHRLSAYERLVRPLQNSLRAYLNGGPDLEPHQMACTKGDADACKAIKAALDPRRMAASAMFRRIGSAFCREAFPDQKWAGVALRFRDREAVPWSKRKGGAPKVTDYELGVFSIDLAVALPGLYRASDE